MSDLLTIVLLVGLIALIIYVKIKYKFPKVGSLALVTGAVKSGKTTFSLSLAISNYNRIIRKWRFKCFFLKLFGKPLPEQPLFYSNIPLGIPYVPVTTDLLERKTRTTWGSVVYLSEASLVADNSLYKNELLSERIMLFNKLCAHSGIACLVYDTQAIGDLPCVTRRCLGQYFYVHHINKWLPFFLVAYVRENRYSEDGSVVSIDSEDIESTLKPVLISRRVWKQFNCVCYRGFTDKLKAETNVVVEPKDSPLVCNKIVSFREYKTIDYETKDC